VEIYGTLVVPAGCWLMLASSSKLSSRVIKIYFNNSEVT
jgi:hypothetical protein